jgi:hypothetical protein
VVSWVSYVPVVISDRVAEEVDVRFLKDEYVPVGKVWVVEEGGLGGCGGVEVLLPNTKTCGIVGSVIRHEVGWGLVCLCYWGHRRMRSMGPGVVLFLGRSGLGRWDDEEGIEGGGRVKIEAPVRWGR